MSMNELKREFLTKEFMGENRYMLKILPLSGIDETIVGYPLDTAKSISAVRSDSFFGIENLTTQRQV